MFCTTTGYFDIYAVTTLASLQGLSYTFFMPTHSCARTSKITETDKIFDFNWGWPLWISFKMYCCIRNINDYSLVFETPPNLRFGAFGILMLVVSEQADWLLMVHFTQASISFCIWHSRGSGGCISLWTPSVNKQMSEELLLTCIEHIQTVVIFFLNTGLILDSLLRLKVWDLRVFSLGFKLHRPF